MKYLVSLAILLYICLTTSVAAKIGIAQVGTASSFLLLLLFIQRLFLDGFDNIVGRFKEEAALYVIAFLVIIFKYLIGETAAIQQIFFFLIVPASFSILLGLQKLRVRKTMVMLIIGLFVFECLLAIYERVTLSNIFAYTTKLEAVEGSAFRSTALMGHPLTNALVVSILMGFIATSYFSSSKKATLLVLGFISLLCFNARGASLAWIIIGAIYLYNFVKTTQIKSSTILAMFFGSLVVVGTLATLIFQYNFGARLVNDQLLDGSAMTRVQVFAAFNFVNSTDFWLGNFENYIPIMKKLGAGGVENSYVVLILNYGIAMAIIICIGLFFLCKRLLKPAPIVSKLIIILSFIMVGSMNNALVSSLPWSVFILCAHAFIPLNKYYSKRYEYLKRKLQEQSTTMPQIRLRRINQLA